MTLSANIVKKQGIHSTTALDATGSHGQGIKYLHESFNIENGLATVQHPAFKKMKCA